jgi:alpha,alpha-trehalose phosphorylase
MVTAEQDVTVPLVGQGPRLYGAPTMRDMAGTRRADGTLLTASIPTLSLDVDEEDSPLSID